MKYDRQKLTEVFDKIDSEFDSITEIIQQVFDQNERYRAALELIRDHGGKEMDESDTDGVIISCNGSWCADQANWALKGEV